MQVELLQKLLSDFSALVEALDAPAHARDLRELQPLFARQAHATVAKYLGDLMKRKPHFEQQESDAIRRVRLVLSKLDSFLVSARNKAAAKDIKLLNDLLENCKHSTVAEFAADANSWLSKPLKSPKSKKEPVPKLAKGLRSDLVVTYLNSLRSAEAQSAEFDQVMSGLTRDKRVRLLEMREIASQYVGFEIAKKKGRGLVLQAIADHQALNARQVARGQA